MQVSSLGIKMNSMSNSQSYLHSAQNSLTPRQRLFEFQMSLKIKKGVHIVEWEKSMLSLTGFLRLLFLNIHPVCTHQRQRHKNAHRCQYDIFIRQCYYWHPIVILIYETHYVAYFKFIASHFTCPLFLYHDSINFLLFGHLDNLCSFRISEANSHSTKFLEVTEL